MSKNKRLNGAMAKSKLDGNNERLENDEIHFYRANEKPYGVFSNLYKRPFIFEGEEYPTAEHAYQAGKPRKKEVREWILNAPTPSLVAMAAHGLYVWDVNSNWSEIKFDRMKSVLKAKFTQHEDLQKILLSTDKKRLVEAGKTNNAVNRLWGEVNGNGKNMLGILLMEIRTELQKKNRSSRSKISKKSKITKEETRKVA